MQQPNDSVKTKILVKDLPLYNQENNKPFYVALVKPPNDFEQGVSELRKEVFGFIDLFDEQKKRAIEFYKCFVYHARTSIDYIHVEANVLPKMAVIAGSGLTGILLGLRRSNFRRLVYSASLMTASTALCYPKEAKHYGSITADWTKKSAKSIYNDYIMPLANRTQHNEVTNNTTKDTIVTYKPSHFEKSNDVDFDGDKGQSKDEDASFYTTRK
jgi:hypothetical protein